MTPAELRKITDRVERAHRATTYIEAGEEKIREVRRLRDDAIRDLVKEHGPAKTARLVGLSLSTVKAICR